LGDGIVEWESSGWDRGAREWFGVRERAGMGWGVHSERGGLWRYI